MGEAWRRIGQAWKMLTGLAIVGRYLFRPPVTIRYPEQHTVVKPRFKGRHYLTLFADGMERCVGCELCVIVCPSQSIFVKAAENDELAPHSKGERYAEDFPDQHAPLHLLRDVRGGVPHRAPSCWGTSTS